MKLYKTIQDFITKSFPDIQTDKQLDTKKGFMRVVFMSLIEFAFLLFFFPMSYEVSDDFIMNSIASGALTGEPSPYLSFTNIIIGYILTLFYKVIPSLNWYTIYMLSSLFIGYTTIQYSFYKFKGDVSIRIIRHLIILAVLLDSIVISGFTRVSTIVGIAGFLVIFLCQGKQKKELIFGVALLLLSSLMRHHVFLMLLMLALPVLFIIFTHKKYFKLIYVGIAIVLSIGTQQIDNYAYKSNPEFKQFTKYRNITAAAYKNNKPKNIKELREYDEDEIDDWSEKEVDMEEQGLLHLNPDSLKQKDYKEILGEKKSFIEKTFDKQIIPEFKIVYKKIWKYIDFRYYYFALIFIIFLFFLGRKPQLFLSLMLYGGYTLFVAFYLHYYFEGVLKNRVLIGMLTPFILLGAYLIDNKGEIPEDIIFLSGMKKQHIALLLVNIALIALFITGFQAKRRSFGTYKRRDKSHSYQSFLVNQNYDFYVRRVSNNPYYIYKNPLDQSNSFRLGWLTYSPGNRDKMEKFTGHRGQSIYEIPNKDIIWCFDPSRLRRNAASIIKYYKKKNENCFFSRRVHDINRYPLYEYTFYNAVPESSQYTLKDVDTMLFNMADTTYQRIMGFNDEEGSETDENTN